MVFRWLVVILAATHGSFTIESDEEMQSDTMRDSLFQNGNTVEVRARSDDSLSTIVIESRADSEEPERLVQDVDFRILRVVMVLILAGALCVALYFGGIIPTNS